MYFFLSNKRTNSPCPRDNHLENGSKCLLFPKMVYVTTWVRFCVSAFLPSIDLWLAHAMKGHNDRRRLFEQPFVSSVSKCTLQAIIEGIEGPVQHKYSVFMCGFQMTFPWTFLNLRFCSETQNAFWKFWEANFWSLNDRDMTSFWKKQWKQCN